MWLRSVCRPRFFSSSQHSPPPFYDITIVGGGIVGGTLAALLQKSEITRSLRIALIDDYVPQAMSEDVSENSSPRARVSAVSIASSEILQAVGAWDRIDARRRNLFTDMHVWSAGGPGYVRFTANGLLPSQVDGVSAENARLGYIVENDLIVSALHEALLQTGFEKATLIDSKVVSLRRSSINNASTEITLANGQIFQSSLVVGADGPGSIVKRSNEIGTWGWDYQQRAVVASVRTETSHRTAWQRFLPAGPVAMLPCHSNYSSIVWTMDIARANEVTHASYGVERFMNDLNSALNDFPHQKHQGDRYSLQSLLPSNFRSLLPIFFPALEIRPPRVVGICGKLLSFPLRVYNANAYYKNRCVLIGDAAHLIHPLAGQGANLGIDDAQELFLAIERAKYSGDDIGNSSMLSQFEAKRMVSNLSMMAGVDAIGHIFSYTDQPFASIRNLGLSIFNSSHDLRAAAASYATGGRTTRSNKFDD